MEPLIAQIMMFGGRFAPRGWAFCDGQLLAISSNTALFSLLGTIYGGDGRVTFGLPDLRGRMPMHVGHGPGLSSRSLGERGGLEETSLSIANMPSHSHLAVATVSDLNIQVSSSEGQSDSPIGQVPAVSAEDNYGPISSPPSTMAAGAVTGQISVSNLNTGGSQPCYNLPPFLGVNFIIALQGIFPARD